MPPARCLGDPLTTFLGEFKGLVHKKYPPAPRCFTAQAGASTAASLSNPPPKAPEDLTDVYLLVVLGANAQSSGNGPVLSIRSLRDRSVTFRCPLSSSLDDVGETGAVARQPGTRVYASPGYGGGAFVVAADGGSGECAKIWRGTFDEGYCCFVCTSYSVTFRRAVCTENTDRKWARSRSGLSRRPVVSLPCVACTMERRIPRMGPVDACSTS